MTRSYEALLNHVGAGDDIGGVAVSDDVTVDSNEAVETSEEDWQNRKTYES